MDFYHYAVAYSFTYGDGTSTTATVSYPSGTVGSNVSEQIASISYTTGDSNGSGIESTTNVEGIYMTVSTTTNQLTFGGFTPTTQTSTVTYYSTIIDNTTTITKTRTQTGVVTPWFDDFPEVATYSVAGDALTNTVKARGGPVASVTYRGMGIKNQLIGDVFYGRLLPIIWTAPRLSTGTFLFNSLSQSAPDNGWLGSLSDDGQGQFTGTTTVNTAEVGDYGAGAVSVFINGLQQTTTGNPNLGIWMGNGDVGNAPSTYDDALYENNGVELNPPIKGYFGYAPVAKTSALFTPLGGNTILPRLYLLRVHTDIESCFKGNSTRKYTFSTGENTSLASVQWKLSGTSWDLYVTAMNEAVTTSTVSSIVNFPTNNDNSETTTYSFTQGMPFFQPRHPYQKSPITSLYGGFCDITVKASNTNNAAGYRKFSKTTLRVGSLPTFSANGLISSIFSDLHIDSNNVYFYPFPIYNVYNTSTSEGQYADSKTILGGVNPFILDAGNVGYDHAQLFLRDFIRFQNFPT